jgi:hypothetical protein
MQPGFLPSMELERAVVENKEIVKGDGAFRYITHILDNGRAR